MRDAEYDGAAPFAMLYHNIFCARRIETIRKQKRGRMTADAFQTGHAMTSPAPLFSQALAHHQSGRLAEAKALYQAALALDPGHADSLHLLGVIACQEREPEAAVALIGRAIAQKGGVAAYHSNLGSALLDLDRAEEAEAAFRTALDLQPAYAEAWCNLAAALLELRRFADAEAAARRALALAPAHPEAHLNLGMAEMRLKRLEAAAASFRAALALAPRMAKAHRNLGVVLKELNQFDAALLCYGRALLLEPDSPDTHLNLGNLLLALRRYEEALGAAEETLRLKPDSALAYLCLGNALDALGRHDEALAAHDQALARTPAFAEALSNKGNVLKELARFDEAEAACRAAIALKPHYAQAHSNLGNVFKEQNRLDEALACYDRALELDPDYAQGHLNRGITRLLRGEEALGWPDYDWRWRLSDWPDRDRLHTRPLWRGEPGEGRSILVFPEQGLGDQINYCRHVPQLAALGWRVVLDCAPALAGLLSGLDGVSLPPPGQPLPDTDVQCPMLSLPRFLPATNVPYLTADPDRAAAWRDRLAALPGHKIGLVWRGNPAMRRDRNRSLPAQAFAALAALPGLTPVILQKDARPEELAALALPPEALVAGPALHDFADTAALIAALDLVVTVDTSVCHLAGALGRPVWTLIEFAPDWRWRLGSERTPLYPSMTLFRQPAPRQWAPVLATVRQRLERLRGLIPSCSDRNRSPPLMRRAGFSETLG